jgi:hypothetical protein
VGGSSCGPFYYGHYFHGGIEETMRNIRQVSQSAPEISTGLTPNPETDKLPLC